MNKQETSDIIELIQKFKLTEAESKNLHIHRGDVFINCSKWRAIRNDLLKGDKKIMECGLNGRL